MCVHVHLGRHGGNTHRNLLDITLVRTYTPSPKSLACNRAPQQMDVYKLLDRRQLVVTRAAVDQLVQRLAWK